MMRKYCLRPGSESEKKKHFMGKGREGRGGGVRVDGVKNGGFFGGGGGERWRGCMRGKMREGWLFNHADHLITESFFVV